MKFLGKDREETYTHSLTIIFIAPFLVIDLGSIIKVMQFQRLYLNSFEIFIPLDSQSSKTIEIVSESFNSREIK